LEQVPPAEVAALLEALLQPTNEKLGRELAALGTYTFIDLAGDDTLELVATLDFSGRAFFNTLLVVRRGAGGFNHQELSGFGMTDLGTRRDRRRGRHPAHGDGHLPRRVDARARRR
jgi:hypothetical protein